MKYFRNTTMKFSYNLRRNRCLLYLYHCKMEVKHIFSKVFNRVLYRKSYTITGKIDGFGAQYQAVMSGIAWSRYLGYKYVHTPFKKTSHEKDVEKLNRFIGIPANNNEGNIDISRGCSVVGYHARNINRVYTKSVLEEIRKYYYTTPKPAIQNYEIAIHIRRGDVTASGSYKERFIATKKYASLIKFLQNKYPNYSICIYSQGKLEDFLELQTPGVFFYLDQEITATFHNLVKAKVLVTAKSSFSYTAALLNEHTIYYKSFWHRPLKHWITIDDFLESS